MPEFQILYVDDEQDNLFAFLAKFKKTYKILTASSANDALEKLAQNKVQLVISDHRMPEMSGVEMLGIVRNKYPETVRIILTAYSDSDDIIDAINHGGIYYFARKPWVSQELAALIERAISFQTISQRNKQLMHKLNNTINELEMFHYRVSHDLRGPVASQFGIISLIKSEKTLTESQVFLDMLEESVHKLDSTIKKIESIHTTDADDQSCEWLDIENILNRVIGQLRGYITARNILVEVAIAPDLQYYSNEEIMYTLFENLVENSVQFVDENKSEKIITINVDMRDHLRIQIGDNGIGINSSQLSNIFDAFYRGTSISKGNGLGLYIVKKAIDNLKGTIKVTSTINVGTEISIELPLQQSL